MRAVAVIACYNEEVRISASVRDALPYVSAVVVVDDGSRDQSGQRAKEAGAHVLTHIINRGQGAALQTGMDYALQVLGAEAIVHFDADGQMLGSEIPMMLEPIEKGEAEAVLGSRFLGRSAENMPAVRQMMIRLGVLFTVLLSGIRVTDTHNGFRAFSASGAKLIRITLDRMAHASEILDLIVAKRLRYVERPVTIWYSAETLGKGQSTFKAVATAIDILKKKFVG
ncbi:MAG: glycosyltransferase family 2 protein [Patescibacteria group bacterium]|jgi:glycosyltransferase involved in cell wall biosynthesis